MGSDTMDLEQLASFLKRDAREVARLVNRGHLPGRKVGGTWRFSRQEVSHWLETQLTGYSEEELRHFESHQQTEPPEPLIANLLHGACVAVPLKATTRSSVLREMINLAEQTWQVYDPQAILEAVRTREDLATTAVEGGVALPHWPRSLDGCLGESLIAFGRTSHGIPFAAPDRELTDMFFLVLCREQPLHLKILARLSRLILRPDFLTGLRAEETAHGARQLILAAEADLLAAEVD